MEDRAEKWDPVIVIDRDSLRWFPEGMRVERPGTSHLCRLAGGQRRMRAPIKSAAEAAIRRSAFAPCIFRKQFRQSTLPGACFGSFRFLPMKRNRLQKSLVRLNSGPADF